MSSLLSLDLSYHACVALLDDNNDGVYYDVLLPDLLLAPLEAANAADQKTDGDYAKCQRAGTVSWYWRFDVKLAVGLIRLLCSATTSV